MTHQQDKYQSDLNSLIDLSKAEPTEPSDPDSIERLRSRIAPDPEPIASYKADLRTARCAWARCASVATGNISSHSE